MEMEQSEVKTNPLAEHILHHLEEQTAGGGEGMTPERKSELMQQAICFVRETYEEPAQFSLKEDGDAEWPGFRNLLETAEGPTSTTMFRLELPTKTEGGGVRTSRADLAELSEELDKAKRAETFAQMLLRLVAQKQITEPELYKSVFMDRRLFNKIVNSPDYRPSKRTAQLLGVALKLNLEQMREFLEKAGYAMMNSDKVDVILKFFITNGNYDIFEINEVLETFGQPLLMKCN